MSGTLRSWVHYISLRHANGTQKEHSDIAFACAKAIEPIFPMISEFVSEPLTISNSQVKDEIVSNAH